MPKHILKSCALSFFLIVLPLFGLCQLPYPKWVNDIGGSGDVKAAGMATDAQNNIYVTGYFTGTVDFDPSAGVTNLTSVGDYDTYVAKYTPAGALVWAVSLGGDGLDQANYLTVDNNGNPTIIGQTQSSTFNAGTYSFPNQGAEDIFVVHLNSSGSVLWAKPIGSYGTDRGEEVNSDAQGNVIMTSIFQESITLGPNMYTALGGSFNGLVTKYDASGNLLWAINLGISGDTEVYGNGIDNNGNIVVSGYCDGSVDFDPLGAHNVVNSNGNKGFVAKYTPAGKLIWVNFINGDFEYKQSIVGLDSNNNIYLTGAFSGSATFNGSIGITAAGSEDTFLAKYSSAGAFQFAKDIGGSGASSYPYQIRADKTNDVYITGYFNGTIDFNPDPTATASISYHGQQDFYIGKYDSNGNYIWAFSGGSTGCSSTAGEELSIDNNNDIVLAGNFCQTVDFDPSTCVADNVTAHGPDFDTYIVKYAQTTAVNPKITAFTLPQQISPAVIDQVNHTISITVAWNTNVTSLIPTITTNAGTLWPASGIAEDFTRPMVYTLTLGCTSTPYTVTVILGPKPKPVTTCAGTVNSIPGDALTITPDSYTWQVFQNNSWINAPGTINAKDFQTSALTNNTNTNIIYSLRREVTTQGVSSYDSYYDVIVQPSAPISGNTLTSPVPSRFCTTDIPANSVIITGSTPTGGNGTYTYQWQSSAVIGTFNDIMGATSKDYTIPSISTTTYYRRIVTSGTCVASSTSNIINITVLPIVTNNTIAAPAVTAFCTTGDPSVITGSSPTGGDNTYNYQWQISTDNSTFTDVAGATGKDFDPGVLSVTTYYRRTVTSGVCNTPLISNVVGIVIAIVPDAPVVMVASTTTSSVTFQWNAVTGATGYQVSTDNGQTFTDPSSGSNGLTHTVDGLQPKQSVSIIVRVAGASPCQPSALSVAVTGTTLSPLGDQIFVANAFTPNGDGKNDIVYVRSANIKSLKFYVYDQWGELLYTSLDQNNGWDGTYKGTKEPVGVYVYYLEAIMNDGQQVNKKGMITLLR